MFVSNFYSFPRVKEFFGEMSKVKDENKIIFTEKGETFTFPFYLTEPSLLLLTEFETVRWRGKVPIEFPPSFIGLFYSFQHFLKVKIIWKSEITGEIGFTEKEMIFKVLNNNTNCSNNSNNRNVLGMVNDVTSINKNKFIDELFPDDLVLETMPMPVTMIMSEIKRIKSHTEFKDDLEEYSRSRIEADKGYHRSISVSAKDKTTDSNCICIATIHLRKCLIQPGTQIFMTIDLNTRIKIDLIKLKLDCIETYPSEFLKPNIEENSWRESVKELKLVPGSRDKIEIVFPVPPELFPSITSKFVTLKWELLTSFLMGEEEFNLIIPLEFISFNLELNKK